MARRMTTRRGTIDTSTLTTMPQPKASTIDGNSNRLTGRISRIKDRRRASRMRANSVSGNTTDARRTTPAGPRSNADSNTVSIGSCCAAQAPGQPALPTDDNTVVCAPFRDVTSLQARVWYGVDDGFERKPIPCRAACEHQHQRIRRRAADPLLERHAIEQKLRPAVEQTVRQVLAAAVEEIDQLIDRPSRAGTGLHPLPFLQHEARVLGHVPVGHGRMHRVTRQRQHRLISGLRINRGCTRAMGLVRAHASVSSTESKRASCLSVVHVGGGSMIAPRRHCSIAAAGGQPDERGHLAFVVPRVCPSGMLARKNRVS